MWICRAKHSIANTLQWQRDAFPSCIDCTPRVQRVDCRHQPLMSSSQFSFAAMATISGFGCDLIVTHLAYMGTFYLPKEGLNVWRWLTRVELLSHAESVEFPKCAHTWSHLFVVERTFRHSGFDRTTRVVAATKATDVTTRER